MLVLDVVGEVSLARSFASIVTTPTGNPAPVERVVLVRPHSRSIAAGAPAATRISLTA